MEKMTQQELDAVLELHDKWLQGEESGKKAELSGRNLSGLNLHTDLSRANLRDANLRDADLRDADLSRADLDFSCWPFWCGSFNVKIDGRLAAQLITHLARCIPTDHQSECIVKHAAEYRNAFCAYRLDVGSID